MAERKRYEVVLANWVRLYARVQVRAEDERVAFQAAKERADEEDLQWWSEKPDSAKVTVYAFKELEQK